MSGYNFAVVGAGILGLAHAYHLARRGWKVIVFESHPRASGASVRNFGMIWPIGQPAGPRHELAVRSREIWLDVLKASGAWYRECGSLHVAYYEDEEQVLREYAASAPQPCEMWTRARVASCFPAVRQQGLRAALWSPIELAVDPPRVIPLLASWLEREYGVAFAFGTTVHRYEDERLITSAGVWDVPGVVVCAGADFHEVFPEAFAKADLIRCKLQMMRSQPYGDRFRIGTHLAAGLTLLHYPSFASCPTLPALASRLTTLMPEHRRFGVHVLVSQTEAGELIIGDSHEYGDAIEPFDRPAIDELILDYMRTFVDVPDLSIAARWHGVYAKHPTEPYVVAGKEVSPTRAVTGVGGNGMTLSFGVAERVIKDWLGYES
jgi:FAD dependent oxidoreductase TIGR03364